MRSRKRSVSSREESSPAAISSAWRASPAKMGSVAGGCSPAARSSACPWCRWSSRCRAASAPPSIGAGHEGEGTGCQRRGPDGTGGGADDAGGGDGIGQQRAVQADDDPRLDHPVQCHADGDRRPGRMADGDDWLHGERVEHRGDAGGHAGSVKPALVAGVAVKPWPGRSGITTVKRFASSGASSRKEWVEAPVPCSSSATGPCPMIWTCQRSPAASMKRLASRCGQSRPSRSQERW